MRAQKFLQTAIEEIQNSVDTQFEDEENSIDYRGNELLTVLENEANNLFSTYKLPKAAHTRESHKSSIQRGKVRGGQRQAVVSV